MSHLIRSTKMSQPMGFIYCATLPLMNWEQNGRDQSLENTINKKE